MDKRHKNYGRWKSASSRHALQLDDIAVFEILVKDLGITMHPALTPKFKSWLKEQLCDTFNQYCMDLRLKAKTEFESAVSLNLPNGAQNRPYPTTTILLPDDAGFVYEITGLEDSGLTLDKMSDNLYILSGIPTKGEDLTLKISYQYPGWTEDQPPLEYTKQIQINVDPRTLWKDLPVRPDIAFPKKDTDCDFMAAGTANGRHMVGASRRGRSHAHIGSPRDDHFTLWHDDKNDWNVLIVADGAGSAKFSRAGSEKACKTALEVCEARLANPDELEQKIADYNTALKSNDEETLPIARKELNIAVYNLVGVAAHAASRAIKELSIQTPESTIKDFSTTMLMAVCKRFDFGWFYATFWVGDGAIGIYDREHHAFTLLGTPDEGEYSGQTRFLTMPEIFKDFNSINSRIRFGIMDDFTALLLMSDGVSDPMFGTDANLNNVDKWDEFWSILQDGSPELSATAVNLADRDPKTKDQLLEWLNFWVQGEHDDRTIALLY